MKNKIALHMCYWSGTKVGESIDRIITNVPNCWMRWLKKALLTLGSSMMA